MSKFSRRIQIRIPKEVQDKIRSFEKGVKLETANKLAYQINDLERAMTLPLREAALRMVQVSQSVNIATQAYAEFSQRHQRIISAFIKRQEHFSETLKLASSNIVSTLLSDLHKIQPDLTFLDELNKMSLSFSAVSALNNVPNVNFANIGHYRADSFALNDVQVDSFQELEDYLEEKINSMPKGLVYAQGVKELFEKVLKYLIALLTLYSLAQNHQTNIQNKILIEQQQETNEYLHSIDNFADSIYSKIESLVDSGGKENILVAKRIATLRKEPDPNSKGVSSVYPNQLLKVVKEQRRWFYVEYYDYRDSVPKKGWIYKGHVNKYSVSK